MSGSEHARPVYRCIWLSEYGAMEHDLEAEWLAAPADPAEAVREAVSTALRTGKSSTAAVLRALGKPDA